MEYTNLLIKAYALQREQILKGIHFSGIAHLAGEMNIHRKLAATLLNDLVDRGLIIRFTRPNPIPAKQDTKHYKMNKEIHYKEIYMYFLPK